MKILKGGMKPKEKIYRATCSNCGCVFEFSEKEATYYGSGDLKIGCPEKGCYNIVWVRDTDFKRD